MFYDTGSREYNAFWRISGRLDPLIKNGAFTYGTGTLISFLCAIFVLKQICSIFLPLLIY